MGTNPSLIVFVFFFPHGVFQVHSVFAKPLHSFLCVLLMTVKDHFSQLK